MSHGIAQRGRTSQPAHDTSPSNANEFAVRDRFTDRGSIPPVITTTVDASPTASDRAFGETSAASDVAGYLGTHHEQVWHALITQLSAMAWPLPRPLAWRVRQMFTQLVVEFLQSHVDLKKPSEVHALVDGASRLDAIAPSMIPKDRSWSAGVGALFTQLVVNATQRAMERAATLYLADLPIEGGTVLQRAIAAAWSFRGTPLIEDPADTAARELAAAKDDTNHVTARWKFLNTLDRVDDPFTRQRMKTHFLRLTGQRLEDFIEHADWHGKRDKEQAEALISEKRGNVEQELAAMDPKKRKELELKALDWAGEIIKHTDKSDANDDDNAQVIFHVLGPRTPVEIELIRAQVRRLSKTHGSVYEHLDRSLARGNEDEAVGALAGDPYGKAMVAIEHAGHDVARLHQIFNDLKVNGQLGGFLSRYKEPAKVQISQAIKARHERDELLAICDEDPNAETHVARTQAHVANLLADPTEDAQLDGTKPDKETERRLKEREPERVIEELEKMSPAELEAASKLKAWDLSRFDDRTQHRIRLLLQGKRAQEKAIGLRIAMAKHDQKAIEAELAAASDDERAEIEKEAQRLDTVEQQQRAAGRGEKDWKNAQGRTLDKQLDAHYTAQEAGPTDDGSIYETARAMVEKENASDDRHAAQEIAKNGKLSEETEIYRARGNLQLKAQLLEKISTNELLYKIRDAHWDKYHAVMLPRPRMSIGPMTILPWEKGYQPDKAREGLDANELRIENIRVFGVPAERSTFVQRGLQLELYRKQHSGALEWDEQIRMARGGAIGSQQAVRDIHSANDEMAMTGESKEMLQHAEAIETQMLEVQREEKKKLAAQFGAMVNSLFKIAAVLTGNPVLFACVDVVGDIASMIAEWSVSREAYDPKEGTKRLLVDGITNLVMVGIAQAKGLSTGGKAIATVGAATTSTVVVDVIDGRPLKDILGDALTTIGMLTLPAAAGDKLQKAIGEKYAKVGKGFNVAAQGATAVGMSGGDLNAGVQQAAGGARGLHEQAKQEKARIHDESSPTVNEKSAEHPRTDQTASHEEVRSTSDEHQTHEKDPPTSANGKPPHVDGVEIAAKVPGATYESGGTYRVTTERGTAEVTIRRTNGKPRVIREGDRIVLEIPRGLDRAAFERAVVEQLNAARDGVGRIVLSGDDHALRAAAEKVKPLAGYVDVVVHADVDGFWIIHEKYDLRLDHRAFAKYLESKGLRGLKVRLIACEAGKNPRAVAQHLANKLGVEVLAPTDTAWIDDSGTLGVGARDKHEGSWTTFEPQRAKKNIAPHTNEMPPHDPDAPEVRPFDFRDRVDANNHAMLQAEIGKPIVVRDGMTDGVTVKVARKRRLFGVDYEVTEVWIGKEARVGDVRAHAELVRLVEKYNGITGKLRRVWERLTGAKGTTFKGRTYPHGSRGWVLVQEIEKLGGHIENTHLLREAGAIDAERARAEIEHLESWEEYFRDQLAMGPEGHDELFDMSRPDIGASTLRAKESSAKYKLPGEEGATIEGMQLNPDDYYYADRSGDFELRRKPGRTNAPQLEARVVGGKFVGVQVPKVEAPKRLSEIPETSSDGKTLQERLFAESKSTKQYMDMVKQHGLASDAVTNMAAKAMYTKLLLADPNASIADWRKAVKGYFRERVIEWMRDPTIDAAAQTRRVREFVGGLNDGDQGSFFEEWRTASYSPGAREQVEFDVQRRTGKNAGKTEGRRADAVHGEEVQEFKSGDGKVDKEQFFADVDLVTGPEGAAMGVKKLRYGFMTPEGALNNLEFFIDNWNALSEGDFTFEYFDRTGNRVEIHNLNDARTTLQELRMHSP
jgi:hypothetical protein